MDMLAHHLNPSIVTGTFPLRPFTQRFVGTVSADGSSARVSAVACDGAGAMSLLSLVGADTTCGAAFAILGQDAPLTFTPDVDLEWTGPRQLRRPTCGMRLHKGVLTGGYRQSYRHVMGLSNNANIAYGLAHPPTIPAIPPTPAEGAPPATPEKPPEPQPRYVFGNLDEGVPHPLALLGQLRALRVIFLPEWVDALWEHGIEAGLITASPALGVCAWCLSDDRERWTACIARGVLDGWLPCGPLQSSTA